MRTEDLGELQAQTALFQAISGHGPNSRPPSFHLVPECWESVKLNASESGLNKKGLNAKSLGSDYKGDFLAGSSVVLVACGCVLMPFRREWTTLLNCRMDKTIVLLAWHFNLAGETMRTRKISEISSHPTRKL